MITHQTTEFFTRRAVTETTRAYMGGLLTIVVTSAESDNRLFLVEVRTQPGTEPTPHIHEEQDEVFYILEGEIEVYCGEQVRIARAGEMVFLPRHQAHAFYFLSPTLRFLVLVLPGNGLELFYEAMSSPATGMELPANTITYAHSDPAPALALAA